MTPPRTLTTAVVGLLTALAAAGCSDASGDAGASDPPSFAGSSSPADVSASSADPEPEAIPSSYPEVGLEYVDLPELDAPYRAALETFVAFDRGRLELMRKVRMNALLSDNAAPAVVAGWDDTLRYLRERDAHYRGETVATFVDVSHEKGFLGLELCVDGSGLRWVEDGRAGAVPGSREGGVPLRAIVTRTDGGWKVTEAQSQEGTC